ncbi:MAG: hypothetical protein WCW27_05815 [Patescibacteria group bacterium]|jgi:hypothetical protein
MKKLLGLILGVVSIVVFTGFTGCTKTTSNPAVNQNINQNLNQTFVSNDECDVVPSRSGSGKMVTADEKNDYACTEQANCEWKNLGGKLETQYACCPKDLTNVNLATTPALDRCFILVD